MKRNLLIFLCVLTVVAASVSCGDPATIAHGEVVDGQGNPLEGVEIVMESEVAGGFRKESEQETGADGKFNFVTITGAARVVRLRFNKEGYIEKTEMIPALQESTRKIVLQKEL